MLQSDINKNLKDNWCWTKVYTTILTDIAPVEVVKLIKTTDIELRGIVIVRLLSSL